MYNRRARVMGHAYHDVIRPDILDSMDRWGRDGVPTGDFLRAVMQDSLMEAMCRADDDNRAALFWIVGYVCNELPLLCHGSPEKVKAWRDEHEAKRRAAINVPAERT
jgi:hypothetical protein